MTQQGRTAARTGGRLEAGHAELDRDAVQGAGGGHGSGDATEPLLTEPRDAVGARRQDREAIGGRDEDARSDNHVAVAVAVEGATDVEGRFGDGSALGVEAGFRGELGRPFEVRVGVNAAEVRPRIASKERRFGLAEFVDEETSRRRACRAVHAVHDRAPTGQRSAQPVEVEARSQLVDVVVAGVDLLDAVGTAAHLGQRERRLVDSLGELLSRGRSVRRVELDPEVAVRAARVVRGRHQHRAVEAPPPHARARRRRAHGPRRHQQPLDAVGVEHGAQRLARLGRVLASVARHQQALDGSRAAPALHQRLREVPRVHASLCPHSSFFAQTRRPGPHALDRRRRHHFHVVNRAAAHAQQPPASDGPRGRHQGPPRGGQDHEPTEHHRFP